MTIKYPESMEECIYFTNRSVDSGKVKCWVFKQKCKECQKAFMGKPVDKKTGRAKIRSKEYVCPSCQHSVEKTQYEETLFANVAYTCPHCAKTGEVEIPYKRKTFMGAKALVFECQSCSQKIPITKKMKATKAKKKKSK